MMEETTDYRRIFRFLRELRDNNDRDWFHSNKAEWTIVKTEADKAAQRLIAKVAEVDSRAAALSIRDCTYRIYRDTRFSTDKTPYKTHIGVFINPPGGKKSATCGYYIHLEPDASMVCAGTIGLDSKMIKAIRTDIFENVEEYRSIVEDPEFKRLLPELGDDPLKTAPKGFPKDWPYIDYLRPRNFVAFGMLPDEFFTEMKAPEEALLPYFKQIKRFNDFMNFSIEPFLPGHGGKEDIPIIY